MNRTIKETIYLVYCCIYTKLFYRKQRLLRLPIDIRGKDGIVFGEGLTTGYHCRLESYSNEGKSLFFGNNIQINDFVHISSLRSVEIGNNVLIASKVFITDITHGEYSNGINESKPDIIVNKRELSAKPVKVEDNVWIGELVSILPGVIIGKNSIIGANSVVTKNIPPNSIAVGNPAKVVKQYNFKTKRWEKI